MVRTKVVMMVVTRVTIDVSTVLPSGLVRSWTVSKTAM